MFLETSGHTVTRLVRKSGNSTERQVLWDPERGSVVRAVVVLRQGFEGTDALALELQDHVKRTTAPYKYPRIVEFRDELPKTASGKIKRAELRGRD